ncbi:MAG: CapA family protein [Candidatus Pacebacteria bacterium]|nr:CapA family protein [Candidatus Paceibacterota bacterium]
MSLKFFACGDIVNFKAKSDFVNAELKNIIQKCDIAIGNFEAPIKIPNMKPIKKAGPHLYQSAESIKYMKTTGFNFVSLANNHIYDYGQESLKATIEELLKYKIDFVGGGLNFEEVYQPKIIEKKGLKIGLLAGCENEFGCLYENQKRGGYAWLFHEKIEDQIRSLKKSVNFIVLIAHAGVEDIEIPIKEWRDRYKRLCDIGVNVIIGHHPHVPQAYEKYQNSLIFYSLGNFYFDKGAFINKSDDSYSVILNFEKEKDINFEIIYHKKINGQTSLACKNDVNFNLNSLNKMLGDKYKKNNDEICLRLFRKYYYNYYINAVGTLPMNANFRQIIKYLIKRLLFKKNMIDNKNLLLLHNIRIDSHRFVVQRALSLISEKIT